MTAQCSPPRSEPAEQRRSSGRGQSRSHSAHIGQDVIIHYRWHPLYGRSVRRIQAERRASAELVHVELTADAVTILPAWKLDAVYCSRLKVGAPQVSLAALCTLHESTHRLRIGAGLRGRQHRHAGGAGWRARLPLARRAELACRHTAPDGTTPARSRSRRRAISGHDRRSAKPC